MVTKNNIKKCNPPILSYAEDYDGVIDREQLITAIANLKPKYRQ